MDPRRIHFDTTAVNMYGDYVLTGPPFDITYGYRKDKRKVDSLREKAGCFVLLTNLLAQQADWPAEALLSLYQSQIGMERNSKRKKRL